MHEDDGFARAGDGGQHLGVEGAGRDVVDDVCPGGGCFLGDSRAVRVNADSDVGGFGHGADVLNDWDHAGELLFFADGDGIRARAFAADVDDGCAGFDEVADGVC